MNFQAYLLEGIARWNANRHAAAVGDGEMSCYNQKLQSAVVRVTTSVGAKLGMTARRPAPYTGELIGMEYLLSQTGEPLAPLCPEEEEAEEDEEEEDVDRDPTVVIETESPAPLAPPPASPSPPPLPLPHVPSASPPPPLISSSPPHLVPGEQPVEVEVERLEPPLLEQVQDEILAAAATGSHCRGPDREPGYDRVIALARHLVSFRRQDVLSDVQIAETTRLFHNLPDMDKARVKFPPRHKNQLSSGRFARKKGNVVSGTEIVKRAFLGQDSTAAQWPHISRLWKA